MIEKKDSKMNKKLLHFLEKFFENSELNRLPKEYGGGEFFLLP